MACIMQPSADRALIERLAHLGVAGGRREAFAFVEMRLGRVNVEVELGHQARRFVRLIGDETLVDEAVYSDPQRLPLRH